MAFKIKHSSCSDSLIPVRDALEVFSGKWRLPIIISIGVGNNRYSSILSSIDRLTPKVLAKELKELETLKLIKREVSTGYPVVITYSLTPYAATAVPIINALKDWGLAHKKMLFKNDDV